MPGRIGGGDGAPRNVGVGERVFRRGRLVTKELLALDREHVAAERLLRGRSAGARRFVGRGLCQPRECET
jgi:hypothetical protein